MRRYYDLSAMKTVFLLLAVILLFTSASASAAAVKSIQVYAIPMQFTFDETKLVPPADQQGFIYNNSTYLPLRFVVHSLNQAVEWDSATSTVTIREPESQERTGIDAYNRGNQAEDADKASVTNAKPALKATSIEISTRKVTYKIAGKTVVPDGGLEGFIINNRLFVPLRFVSSLIGYEVEWDQSTYSVALQSPEFIAQQLADGEDTGGETPSELPTDLPEETVVPVVPSGGGGVITTTPTYDSLVSQADTQISALRSSCESSLWRLVGEYINKTDPTAKQDLVDQGQAQLAQCDAQFEALMTSLQSSLIANGYSTSIITTYRDAYAEEKALAESLLTN
ncbi:MAG: copper amine oxidase N-terminal domain-containing protein [Paenibacillaceae bacterium]